MDSHFIDNSAAESSLIRDASSSVLGDHIIGLTWNYIQKRNLWAYFDRIESGANPLDGLSRHEFRGPWERVQVRQFPTDEIVRYASDFADMTYGGIHYTNFL